MFFISPAYAQASSGGGLGGLESIAPILIMLPIFYFLLIRPQQQRAKKHQEMVTNIRRGDTVVTSSGIIGTVVKVKDDNELLVEIAKDTQVRMIKGMVAEVRVKGEPVKDAA
jgi:preprotein translocase subunit YajC